MITPRIPPKNAVSAIRFERERRVFDEIIQNQVIQNLANEIRTKGEADLERKRLLTSSLKITDRLMPGLVRTVKNVQQIINESRNIEVYVYGDAQLNAACADFGRGTLFVMLTSRLVENLTEDELLFVIGHELGHAIYSHHALPTRAILARARSIPVVWTLKLMSWSRCAEISADRVGLLCCQDIDTATRVLVKLTSGLTKISLDPESLEEQMREFDRMPFETKDISDLFSDHPYNPLRATALHYFWDSDLLRNFIQIPNFKMTIQEVDKRINALLALMEPETKEAMMDAKRAEGACLLWGCFWVASADKVFHPNELINIQSIVDSKSFYEAENEIGKSSDPTELIKNRFCQAAELYRRSPLPEKQVLIQRMIAVAKADGQVQAEEKAILREICREIGIDPLFVDQILILFE